MAIISFDLPPAVLTRIDGIISDLGYVYDPENVGQTDAQQKLAFFKTVVIGQIRDLIFELEKNQFRTQSRTQMETLRQQAETSIDQIVQVDTGSIV